MKSLSVVFPVYNERESIESVFREWQLVLKQINIPFELVICEDGSTDGTSEFLHKIKKKYNLTLDQNSIRRGYGSAVLSGIQTAKYPFILCVDSDGQCDPSDLPSFLKSFRKNEVKIGWRTMRKDASQRLLFSKAFKIIFSILFPNSLHDPSAPFVLFEKKTVNRIIPFLGYLHEGFWWGFVGACLKTNTLITEFPISHRRRLVGETQIYHPKKILSIALRNIMGLCFLRFSYV